MTPDTAGPGGQDRVTDSAALPRYVPPRGAGDHALALHALSIVRSEMAGMTYRSIDGVRDNEQVAHQMLDTIENLIKHHSAQQMMEARRGT